jgi:hypothetical protein
VPVVQLGVPDLLETLRPLPARSPVPERVTAVAATADLSRTAVATATPWYPGFAEVLLLAGGTVTRLAGPSAWPVVDLVFDPDGSALTAMDDGNRVLRWTLDAPGEPWCPPLTGSGGSDGPSLAQAAAGGGFLAASNWFTGNVAVWDAATRRPVHDIGRLSASDRRVRGEGTVALSADGSRLAFSHAFRYFSEEGVVVVQETGHDTHTEYRTGIRWLNGLAFAPDAATLAVVGARPDETVAAIVDLNDPAAHPEPLVLPTGERVDRINLKPVWCGAEPRVAIVDEHRVTVWNLASASALLEVEAPGSQSAASLTPDGGTLLVASPDEGVHAHPLP